MRVWIASLLFYFTVFLICELARYIINKYFKDKYPNQVTLLNEFIGTIQTCAPMFDVNFVLDTYGLQGVLIEIAFLELVNAFLQRDAFADPCPVIINFANGVVSVYRLISTLAVQFAAAEFSYYLARQFWKLGIHSLHVDYLNQECSADLATTMFYGTAVEAAGVIVGKVAQIFLEQHLVSELQVSIAQAILSGIVTILGIHLTGMYANPIVAWACTFNCGRVSHLTHFVVYWIAPITAWFLSDIILSAPANPKTD